MMKKNILQIVVEGKTSTSEIIKRCLDGDLVINNEKYNVQQVFVNNLICNNSVLSKRDIHFLIRVASPEASSYFAQLKKYNINYSYLIDDNFWLLNGDSPLDLFYQHPHVRSMLEKLVSNAQVVFCHSENFKKFLSQFNSNIEILPTYFDFSCIDDLREIVFDKTELRIGVVGNISRSLDMELIVPAVLDVLNTCDKNVFFEFFGYTPESLKDHPRVRTLKSIPNYNDFIRAQYSRGWFLALAPLRDSKFASYKTNNKFREFGGCGIAAIYSDIQIYKEDVEDGVTGWLVKDNSSDWASKIKYAIENQEITQSIAEKAREVVFHKYDLFNVRNKWVEELSKIRRGKFNLGDRFVRKIIKYYVKDFLVIIDPYKKKKFLDRLNSFARDQLDLTKVVFINPDDKLCSELTSVFDGEIIWSVILATFCVEPYGEVLIKILREDGTSEVHKYEQDRLQDGGVLKFKVNLKLNERVCIQFENKTDRNIGLYVLSKNSKYFCESNKNEFSGNFFV